MLDETKKIVPSAISADLIRFAARNSLASVSSDKEICRQVSLASADAVTATQFFQNCIWFDAEARCCSPVNRSSHRRAAANRTPLQSSSSEYKGADR
jgi:hypothetical protein